MYLRNQSKQMIERARRRLEIEIEANGIMMHWKEPVYAPDGMGGQLMIAENKHKVKGIIVTTRNGGGSNMSMPDSGRKEPGTHTLTILYDKRIRPEYLTEFYTDDNKQYRVVSVTNVDNLNLYYTIELKYTQAKMKGYRDGERSTKN